MRFANIAGLPCLLAAVMLSSMACGSSEPTGPAAPVVNDVTALQETVAADTCPSAVEDVDREVDDDKPVAAAGLLRGAAIPAAARQVERVRALTLHTADGRTLQAEVVRLYDARRAALVLYADALERGVMEDMQLIMALDAQRQADTALSAFLRRLEVMRPLNTPDRVSDEAEDTEDGPGAPHAPTTGPR